MKFSFVKNKPFLPYAYEKLDGKRLLLFILLRRNFDKAFELPVEIGEIIETGLKTGITH